MLLDTPTTSVVREIVHHAWGALFFPDCGSSKIQFWKEG